MNMDEFRAALEDSAVYFRHVIHRYNGVLMADEGNGWYITTYSIIWLYEMYKEHSYLFKFSGRSKRYV